MQSAITRVAFRAAIVGNDVLIRFGNGKPGHRSVFRTHSIWWTAVGKSFLYRALYAGKRKCQERILDVLYRDGNLVDFALSDELALTQWLSMTDFHMKSTI